MHRINSSLALVGLASLSFGMIAKTARAETTCVVSRSGLQFRCPSGWFVLNDESNQLVIGNYQREPETPKTVFGGIGRAWISIQTRPAAYRSMAQWVLAGKKLVPDAEESRFTVQNGGVTISVMCLESKPGSRPAFVSSFFEVSGVPTLLELNYRADDPKKDEYRIVVKEMISGATPKPKDD